MDREAQIAVVIVNYNGMDYIEECLESLRQQTFQGFGVVVFDNGSSDGSVELIVREFPEVAIIRSSVNLGFAAGNNRAIERVLSNEGVEYILALNNDMVLHKECLRRLYRKMENSPPEVCSCQPKILFMRDGTRTNILNNTGLSIWLDGTAFDRGINEIDEGQYDDNRDIFGTCGGASLFRRSALETVGLFDEDFFAYFEDVDLAWRQRRAGFRSLLVSEAKCFHRHHATRMSKAWYNRIHSRNRAWVLLKDYPIEYVILSPVFTMARWFYYAYYAISRARRLGSQPDSPQEEHGLIHRVKTVLAVLLGYWEALLGIPGCIRKRRRVNNLTTLSRKELSALVRGYSARLKR